MERNKQSSLKHKPYCSINQEKRCCVSITIVLTAESLVSTAVFHIKLCVFSGIAVEVRAKDIKLTETIIPSKARTAQPPPLLTYF